MLAIAKIEQKGVIFRELATMIKAGMSLGEAFGVLQTRRTYPPLMRFLLDAAKRVPQGVRLSEVIKAHPGEFSTLTGGVIAVGEDTGKLEEALDAVAEYWEREYRLRQMVSRETFYPKVLAVCVIVLPVVTQAIVAGILGSSLSSVLWVLVKTLGLYAVAFAVPLAIIYLAYRAFIRPQAGRVFLDTVKLNVPLFGPVVRKLALAKFMRALAYGYSAGLSIARVVELSADATGNAVISRRLRATVPHLRKGSKLSGMLAGVPEVDAMVVQMLQTGEQTGNIDETMLRVAEYFEIASESSIQRMATLALPIGVIIMGIVVAIKVITFYSGYYASY